MIAAQTFLIYLSFHNAVWPLFFLAAFIWWFWTWRDIQSGRFLIAVFVRLTQLLLLMTGFVSLYMFEFMPYYAVKGAIAIAMFYFYEKGRIALKTNNMSSFYFNGGLTVVTAVFVLLLGIYGR